MIAITKEHLVYKSFANLLIRGQEIIDFDLDCLAQLEGNNLLYKLNKYLCNLKCHVRPEMTIWQLFMII